MSIDVSDVINDQDFSGAFTVLRSQGSWNNGVWNPGTPQQVTLYGAIQPASEKETRVLPEGDQIVAAIKVYCTSPLYTTQVSPTAATSDLVVWNGENYRVLKLLPWQGNGYYRAIAARMAGD